MIITLFRRVLWLIGILALQVLFFANLNIMGYATALVCPWFVLMMPQGIGRCEAMLWAFVLGLAADAFDNTPGLSAAAMTFAALLQPVAVNMLMTKDAIEGFTPSYKTMGKWGYIRLCAIILLCHHLLYYSLEAMTMAHFIDSALRAATGYALSLLLILGLELLRRPSQ